MKLLINKYNYIKFVLIFGINFVIHTFPRCCWITTLDLWEYNKYNFEKEQIHLVYAAYGLTANVCNTYYLIMTTNL